jgi:hypothetical protein
MFTFQQLQDSSSKLWGYIWQTEHRVTVLLNPKLCIKHNGV